MQNKPTLDTKRQPRLGQKRPMRGAIAVLSAATLAALTVAVLVVQKPTAISTNHHCEQAHYSGHYAATKVANQIGGKSPPESHATDQVLIPAPGGNTWLSFDKFEVTNRDFKRFIDASGYVTVAERVLDDSFGAGSAVFTQPESVTDAAMTQWWSYIEGASWRHPEGPGSDISGKDNYPVVQLALEDVEAYASWAGRRLPTSSEWELAARHGESPHRRLWHRGAKSSTASTRNDSGNVWLANTWQGIFPIRDKALDGFTGMAPVGCFTPLASGLHDMIGNVWEWVDTRELKPAKAGSVPRISDEPLSLIPNSVPDGTLAGNTVSTVPQAQIMGGSFLCSANFCMNYHPAASLEQDITLGTNHIGFRTVLELAEKPAAANQTTASNQAAAIGAAKGFLQN